MNQEEIDAFLREPRIADFATVRPDGSPHVVPVWFLYDGAALKIVTDSKSVKARNLQNERRVALSIATQNPPYRYVTVQGRADVTFDGGEEMLREIAVHYKGEAGGAEYADQMMDEGDWCVITVTPRRISGWEDD